MTQGERSKTMKAVLKWLNDSEKGYPISTIIRYVVNEITELGATERTAKSYVRSLEANYLISAGDGYRFKITPAGKKWLKRHT